MHILSLVTDNCPTWISGRERMAVEMVSWPISMNLIECCRTGLPNLQPLEHQSNAHPTKLLGPALKKEWYTYFVRHFLVNTNVALTTVSPSTHPAGTINSSPSGVNVNRRKKDRIVSSWNILNILGLTSLFSSLSFLAGWGSDILCTLCIHCLVDMLYILHDLKNYNNQC